MSNTLDGIKLPHLKNTENSQGEVMPVPDFVKILMSQHIGEPCTPLVAVGDKVKVGQMIGDSQALISAPIHSSVSGIVTSIDDFTMPNGSMNKAIVIETDKLQELDEKIAPPVLTDQQSFIDAVRASGMVGLGGAGFPTHVKYDHKKMGAVETLIVNAAECEPYITSDYETMMTQTDDMFNGIQTIMKYVNLKRCIIAIEDNKGKAIEIIKEMAKSYEGVQVLELPSMYPQGAEKVLIYNALGGLIVPENKLPSDVGVIVSNVTTVTELGRFMADGIPLVNKRVTVDGGAIAEPKNVVAPIGTSIKDLIDFCGGYKSKPSKILLGGPMMGLAINNDSFPMLKNNNAIIAFDETEATAYAETPCIRCGECARVCPIRLTPYQMKSATANQDADRLKELKVNLCIECGCCSYVCPAKQELVQSHRLGKKIIRGEKHNGRGN